MSREEENFELAKSQYSLFVKSLDQHYAEILKFLAIIAPSLAAFGFSINQFMSPGSSVPTSYFVFVTFAVLIVLGWGAIYVLTLSYRFQYLRFIVSKIESAYELTNFMPDSFKPKRMARKEKLTLEMLPEIMKVHFFFFSVSIVIIVIASSLLLNDFLWRVSIPLFGLLFLGFIYFLGSQFFPNKYNKLFD